MLRVLKNNRQENGRNNFANGIIIVLANKTKAVYVNSKCIWAFWLVLMNAFLTIVSFWFLFAFLYVCWDNLRFSTRSWLFLYFLEESEYRDQLSDIVWDYWIFHGKFINIIRDLALPKVLNVSNLFSLLCPEKMYSCSHKSHIVI